MTMQGQQVESSTPPDAVPGQARTAQPPARQNRRDEESLAVEIAWLIIDGAKVLRRVRRILARI